MLHFFYFRRCGLSTLWDFTSLRYFVKSCRVSNARRLGNSFITLFIFFVHHQFVIRYSPLYFCRYIVDRLSQGFEEAKLAANSAFKELCEEILRSNSLKDHITDLKTRIATLTSENESLLKRTMDLTEDVSALSAIATNKRYVPVMQRIIWHHVLQQPLLQLPLTIGFNYAPPNFLFNLLGCPQSSTPELISENVKCLLQILHPDKNPQAPPTASQYIPLISFAKTILLDKSLSPVYRCCGLDGIARRQHKLRTCRRCDPFLQTLNDLMDQ